MFRTRSHRFEQGVGPPAPRLAPPGAAGGPDHADRHPDRRAVHLAQPAVRRGPVLHRPDRHGLRHRPARPPSADLHQLGRRHAAGHHQRRGHGDRRRRRRRLPDQPARTPTPRSPARSRRRSTSPITVTVSDTGQRHHCRSPSTARPACSTPTCRRATRSRARRRQTFTGVGGTNTPARPAPPTRP